MMAMLAVVVSAPYGCARGGSSRTANNSTHGRREYPVGVIIKIPRVGMVTARESKTESFNSASDERLCVRTVRGESESTYRQCDQQKFFHELLSFVCCFSGMGARCEAFREALKSNAFLHEGIGYPRSRGSHRAARRAD